MNTYLNRTTQQLKNDAIVLKFRIGIKKNALSKAYLNHRKITVIRTIRDELTKLENELTLVKLKLKLRQ